MPSFSSRTSLIFETWQPAIEQTNEEGGAGGTMNGVSKRQRERSPVKRVVPQQTHLVVGFNVQLDLGGQRDRREVEVERDPK